MVSRRGQYRYCWRPGRGQWLLLVFLLSYVMLVFRNPRSGDFANAAVPQGVGASWFGISILGWYLLLIQLLSTMGFQTSLPVGDLTHLWDRKKAVSASPA